jgi:hypothetical protein
LGLQAVLQGQAQLVPLLQVEPLSPLLQAVLLGQVRLQAQL